MKVYLIGFVLFISPMSRATEVLDFKDLWSELRAHSPRLSSNAHIVNASQLERKRAERLWLPSFALDGRAFSSNDSGLNFSSILGERGLSASDFNPAYLNSPGFNTFETLGLGAEFLIYDGGLSSAEKDQANYLSEAARNTEFLETLKEFVDTAKQFALISSLERAQERLQALKERVSTLLAHYSIGNKSNGVGYAGLLGMKSLKNRIESILIQIKMERETQVEAISLRAKHSPDWTPKLEDTKQFLDRVLPLNQPNDNQISFQVGTENANEIASRSAVAIEKAKYLPKIGLFANEALTHGTRSTGTSFTGGLYLKWMLFDPLTFGKVDQSKELHDSVVDRVEETKIDEIISSRSSKNKEEALTLNLALLQESETFLEEQTNTITHLFKSGGVTALQLAEVLNRRVDLVLELSQLQLKLINARAEQRQLIGRVDDARE